MITYTQCPVCSSNNISDALSAKDNTVSQQQFTICSCQHCTHLFTQHIPTQDAIGAFYQSENYISHSDTQQGIVNKLYHFVRKLTLQKKLQLLQKYTGKKTGSVLDIGCGTGAFLHTMQQAGWQCTGLEPDEAARKKAKELYKINAQPSQQIYNLPLQTYDAITMWHVLEHVHELHEYIAQLKKLITVDGKIFIAVPNHTSYDAAHYGKFWAAYDVPRHLYHFSPASMNKLMDLHGLVIKKMKPMWFDSFYVSMLSEKYSNGKGNLAKAFLVGLLSNIKTISNNNKCSSVIYIIENKV